MSGNDKYSEADTASRRDEVIRRMANTPPQPKSKTLHRRKKGKKAGVGRAVGKGRVAHER